LGFSVQLWRHVAAGREVHLLALTRGTATRVRGELNGEVVPSWWNIRHDPTLEGYAPLDRAAVGRARMREQAAACAAVGIGADRIHDAELQDGAVTTAQVKATIVALADELDPDTGLWAPSYLVDNHPDHLAAGQAVRALGREQPTRFWDRRYIVLRRYWTDPRLAQVPGEVYATPATSEERRRTINAARCYGAWQPRSGAFAVGHHSTPTLFDAALRDPKALVHKD
jgi:LmbE family N-acetylglucosaminyl deacetylase